MIKVLTYNDFDRDFWVRELEDFVPRKIYDMHAHLWTENGQEHLPPPDSVLRSEVDFPGLLAWSAQVFPGRECHFLTLGTPIPGVNTVNQNKWLANEVTADNKSIAGMIVTPQTTQDELNEGFVKYKFHTVKPYRLFAADPRCARIVDFLPEPLLEIINEHGKAVTLHLSMPDGVDSPQNISDLKYLTKKYPNIKWILAHCARAFNSIFLEKSIHVLKHLPNIYYDTSAVNDLYTHYLLLKHENINRIMFGSDNVAAGCGRGKYITYARAWQFYPGVEQLEHCEGRATLVVYEQLLQQKRAADILELSTDAIDKLFWTNAEKLINNLKGRKNNE
jgi:predicted TIM-barrel fold metal-dependent hydrolase